MSSLLSLLTPATADEAEPIAGGWDFIENPTTEVSIATGNADLHIGGSAIAELKENKSTKKMAESMSSACRQQILTPEVRAQLYLINKGREADDIEPVTVTDDTGASVKVGFSSKAPAAIKDSKDISTIKTKNKLWADTYTETMHFTVRQGAVAPEVWDKFLALAKEHSIPVSSVLIQTNPTITDPRMQCALDTRFKTRGYKVG